MSQTKGPILFDGQPPSVGPTPYDAHIRELAQDLGLSLNQARDRFIHLGLLMGDVGPISCFLLRGYVPKLAIRQRLALMMTPEEALGRFTTDQLTYRFEIKSRTGKRGPKRSNLRIALRNLRFAKRVKNLIAKLSPGSYEAAIKQVADETHFSEQTIRDAYDHGREMIK